MKKFLIPLLMVAASLFASNASAVALTDFAENKLIDAIMRGQASGIPATWHVALYTTCPTDSSAGTEVSTVNTNYAPVAVTANMTNWKGTQGTTGSASSGNNGTTSNASIIQYGAPTAAGSGGVAWGVINCIGLKDATSGNLWVYTSISPKTVNAGDAAPSIAVDAFTFQIDNN
jgi:hypothetical protein